MVVCFAKGVRKFALEYGWAWREGSLCLVSVQSWEQGDRMQERLIAPLCVFVSDR